MKRYIASECIASILATALSALVAQSIKRAGGSAALNSVLSAVTATACFNLVMVICFVLFHNHHYQKGHRRFSRDMWTILKGNVKGIVAAYVIRIPLQYIFLRSHWRAALSAVVAHTIASLFALSIRMWNGHRNQLFQLPKTKGAHVPDTEPDAIS